MLAATILTPSQTVALAFVCSVLRGLFDTPSPPLEILARFLGLVAYAGSGLIVTALIRHRALVMEHLVRMGQEQELRHQLEEQLKVLVESSPAAILTMDSRGVVLACNRAADKLLLAKEGESLRGRAIGGYLPVLADALKIDAGPEGCAQPRNARAGENGEIFLAHTWFSSYVTPQGPRLAAIVVDSSEEMRDREEQGLRHLMRGNRIAAAAVSHEVRNLCSAISSVCSNLKERHRIGHDEDFQGLTTLVRGLERIADCGPVRTDPRHSQRSDAGAGGAGRFAHCDRTRLAGDRRRHHLESSGCHACSAWGKAWTSPGLPESGQKQLPLRAGSRRTRTADYGDHRRPGAHIQFQDSGPGISATEHLFEPFHSGADGAGLGLYVSRAVVRSYGGDLRLEAPNCGTCFRVEVQVLD